MHQRATTLLLLGLAAVLGGCGNQDALTRPFGMARDAPGGSGNVPLLPLSVPPSIGDRPARPGASAIPTTVAPPPSQAASGASPGQQAFVEAAGGSTASADEIRQRIDEDARLLRPSPQFVSELLNWGPPPGYASLFQQPRKSWFGRLF